MQRFFVLLAGLALAGLTGCSKSAECDPSRCAAGNKCVDDGSGAGATCHLVCKKQDDCPTNYACNDGLANGGTTSWCVPNTFGFEAGTGQWFTTCNPGKGEGANPDCNWNEGFACYGTGPSDGNAFCTQFACGADADCPGGWWCSTQNVGPNVTSADPTFGKTRTVCLPRNYCAPCKKDLDCTPKYVPSSGPALQCVPDTKGASFCSPPCAGDANCNFDATCRPPWWVCMPAAGPPCQTDDDCPPANGTYQHCAGGTCTPECGMASDCAASQKCESTLTVCMPRAGVCAGDGTFCSPCRSDVDCTPKTGALGAPQPAGYCLNASYSTERFCSAPAAGGCDGGASACPQPQSGQNWKNVGCTRMSPPDQCVGVVTIGTSAGTPTGVLGCWTANR
jgi:hypothetical protein